MGRIELVIYDAVTKEQKACVNKWKFQDAMMGERFITFTLTSENPIEWNIGDYCVYRDEMFWLNNVPTVTQKAPVGAVQNGFTYENVKLDSSQEELTRCMMLDVTPTTPEYQAALGTNHTGSSRFQLYCGETAYNGRTLTPVCALALKIQANLDRLYPGRWHVYVDTESTYTTSSGKVMLATHTDDKLLSFDNTTVAAALAMVNSEFDLDFTVRFRNIYIGYALNELTADDVGEMFVFGYGKGYPSAENQGKGLFQIKQTANNQQKIVTRLRALGSTKNMPYRYYNKKYGGESNPDLSQSLFPTNLQLPGTFLPEGQPSDTANAKGSTKWARNNARSSYLRAVKGDTNDSFIDKNDDAEGCNEGIREDSARWDGSNSDLPEIYPTIEGVTYGELRESGVEDMDGNAGANSFQGTTVHPDDERIDSLLAVGYTDNGVLIDDANVGDGINPEETSYSTTVKPAVIGQTKLDYRPSEYGEDLSFEGDETVLFTINNVSPGKYFMVPTGGGYTSVMFSYWLSSAAATASVGYVIRVKQRTASGTTLIAEYFSAFSLVADTATHEIALPELPNSKDTPGEQVKDITVTALCDVVVTFAPVISEMQGGRFTLNYQVGRSVLHPSDDYDPEYNWGPVDGGIAANGSFHVFIKDMGFNLTATFTGDTPIMAMKSGRCVGREFEIGENVVPATVNGVKGYMLTLNRVQDSNLGTYYPSETDPIAAGDYFVFLGISMPDAYIEAAEARLLMAATDYLADNCETKFTYQPSIDDIYLQRQHDNMVKAGAPEKSVYSRLYAGLRFSFKGIPSNAEDPLPRIDIAIQQVTITMGEGLTPKVDIVLNDDVQQSTIQRLTTAVDRIYNGSAYASGGGANLGMLYELLLTEGGRMFLSRINDDTANGKITFKDIITALDLIKAKGGINVGEFIPGWLGAGAKIGSDGRAEFEEVYVRGALRAAELVFNRIRAEEGEAIRSIGHGEILTVDESTMTATLKLEGDEWATIDAGDICRGLYNTIDKDYTAEDEGEDDNGFRLEKGFFASYFKVEEVMTNGKGECSFRYSLQPGTTEHPCPLMKFAVYGNTDDSKKERQSSMYITAVGIAPRLLFLAGVNDWQIKPQNIKAALGNLNDLQVYEETDNGDIVLKTLYGDAGLYVEDNIYLGGAINQFIHATIEDIIGDIDPGQGIHAQLLRGSDNIVVDAVGNIVGGIYEEFGDGTTVNRRYKLHTGVLVYDSGKGIYLSLAEGDTIGENEFKISYVTDGCDVLRDGSDFYITNIHHTNDGLSDTVLSDDELETMRNTEQCGINFVIETASGWKTQVSYPIKITHLDHAYVTFDLDNDFDSISYRTQLSRYDGIPVTTRLRATVNGVEIPTFESITVVSDIFGTVTVGSQPITVPHAASGLAMTVNPSGQITIGKRGDYFDQKDLEDAKHVFQISGVVKYAGVSYESGVKQFTLQEITDSTLYDLIMSATAVSKDGSVFTPDTVDVNVRITDNTGVTVKTASEMESTNVKVRYLKGVYNPSWSATTLINSWSAQQPAFSDPNVTTCVTVLLADLTDPTAPIILDVQSITINAVGKDGAGQPYVKTYVDSFTIDCDSDGKPLTAPAPIVVEASLYWGDNLCALNFSDCTISYNGTPCQLTNNQIAESVTATIAISQSDVLKSSNIEIYLTGHYDGEAHSATKTIPVVANRQGEPGPQGDQGDDGNEGRGIVSMVTYYKRSASSSGVTTPGINTDPTTAGWASSRIEPTETEPYLWRFTRTTYTSGTLVEQTGAELIYVWQDAVNPNLLADTEFQSNSKIDAWYKAGEMDNTANTNKQTYGSGVVSTYTNGQGYNQYHVKYKAQDNDGENSGKGQINFLYQYVFNESQGIAKIEADKWYTLSFYIYGKKGTDGTADENSFIFACNMNEISVPLTDGNVMYVDGTAVTNTYRNFNLGGNSFERHTITFKTPATLSGTMSVKFIMYTREYTQDVWLCKPKLEVGVTATEYQPMRTVTEPMARCTTWEEGKQYYQGAAGEPYLDIVQRYNTWYRCRRTHISTSGNKPQEGATTAEWLWANNFKFVATDLLLADQGVIDLLFSQKILMRNAKNQLTASLNYDGEGSYVIYYPESGRKRMQMGSDGYWRYFNDDEYNTENWHLGLGGEIEMKDVTTDDWVRVELAPCDPEMTFSEGDTFDLNKGYYRFSAGTGSNFPQYNNYYYTGRANNPTVATPLNGYYLASRGVAKAIAGTLEEEDNYLYVTIYYIVNGRKTQEITRKKDANGVYTNEII